MPTTRAVINAVRGIAAMERKCETRWIQEGLPPPLRLFENQQLRALINEDVKQQWAEEYKTGTGDITVEQNYRKTFDELSDMLSADASKPHPSWTAEERRVFAQVLKESEPIYQRYAIFNNCMTFAMLIGFPNAAWRGIRFVFGYKASEDLQLFQNCNHFPKIPRLYSKACHRVVPTRTAHGSGRRTRTPRNTRNMLSAAFDTEFAIHSETTKNNSRLVLLLVAPKSKNFKHTPISCS